jgi:hypothetical protein
MLRCEHEEQTTKKEILRELKEIAPLAQDTNQAVMMLIDTLSHHYKNALLCYDKLEKYEKHPVIKILRKLKVIK